MLTIRLREPPAHRLDLGGLTPDRLADKSLAEIAALLVTLGRSAIGLGALASLSGDPADGAVRLENTNHRCAHLAAGMGTGVVMVAGDAGPLAGAGMTGGTLRIAGSAGAELGAGMAGGLIDVKGDAGDHAGAALPGAKVGMAGGTILIHGRAGDYLAAGQRAGLIAVAGGCGDHLAAWMRAGTALVFGPTGQHVGLGMVRGTVGVFGPADPQRLAPGFVAACVEEPAFLGLYRRELARLGFAGCLGRFPQRVVRFRGDLAELGKGEAFLAA